MIIQFRCIFPLEFQGINVSPTSTVFWHLCLEVNKLVLSPNKSVAFSGYFGGHSLISILQTQWQENITRLDPRQGEGRAMASCSHPISLVLTDGQLTKTVFTMGCKIHTHTYIVSLYM